MLVEHICTNEIPHDVPGLEHLENVGTEDYIYRSVMDAPRDHGVTSGIKSGAGGGGGGRTSVFVEM